MSAFHNTRREYIILPASDPVSGGKCHVQISFDRMQVVGRRSLGHAKECGLIVPQVLLNPSALFEGLTRDEDEDQRGYGWRCYCGQPTCSYSIDGIESPPYPGQVFLVFINDQAVAYNWRWEKAEADAPNLPINYKVRFRRRLL